VVRSAVHRLLQEEEEEEEEFIQNRRRRAISRGKYNSLSRGADAGQPSGVGEIPLPTRTAPLRRELLPYSCGSAVMLRRRATVPSSFCKRGGLRA